jgi:peroxiredoxin
MCVMRISRVLVAAASAAALALPVTVQAQGMMAHAATMGPADGRDLAPTQIERVAIGTAAPDFTLTKQGGGTLTLSSFRGHKNVVLVFYRGYWCPFCIKQLTAMRTMLDADMKKDTELLVVSVDGEDQTRQTITRISADGAQADFTFLSDPDHAVIARYGILNPSGGSRGIPHPATYVIDRDGVVRWRDVETDYKIRPANEAVVTAVRSLPHAMMRR